MTIDEKDALLESYTALNNSFNQLLQKMEDLYSKKEQITEETFNALIAKGNEIELIIAQGKSALDALNNEKLASIHSLSEESMTNIQNKTDENIGRLETLSEEKLAKLDEIIKDNLAGVYSHLFSLEKVLMDKKIIKLTYKE